MKIIELLNKIANGEEVPKKIKYRNWLYEFKKNYNDYLCQYDSLLYRENDDVRQFLNDEVEILDNLEEEKKIPEKLPTYDCIDAYSKFDINDNRKIINELIDYLKSKGENNDI